MRLLPVLLLLFSGLTLLPPNALAKKGPTDYPATYAGGSLPLDHHRVRAALGKDAVVFMQGSRSVAVPLKNITEISYGTEVRRRLGASVLDVVPLMHLGESETRYIGVTWTRASGDIRQAQVLLQLNRNEYRELLAALEQLTGIKAVNTNQVPTVVRYEI